MFKSKLEVDRHIEKCLKSVNEIERPLKYFQFAQLYYKIGEYEQARRYVTVYLGARPQAVNALNLLGRSLEKLGRPEAALDAYRSSLNQDYKQNNIVIKICELLAMDNVNLEPSIARYYCEKAQSLDPHVPAVFSLKERLVAAESRTPEDLTKLYLTELESKPTDVGLRVKLLRHLLQNSHIDEAYRHVSDIEQKNLPIFLNSIVWYEVVADILVRYQRDKALSTTLDWKFWMLIVSVLDKLVALSLDERINSIRGGPECVATVFNFDQTLAVAVTGVESCPEKPLLQEFLNHYRGQLYLHTATLLFKNARRDLMTYKEAMDLALPLLFAAYHTSPADFKGLWLDSGPESYRKQVQRWNHEGAFRCSQSGHVILAAAKDRTAIIVEKTIQRCSGQWREQVFKKLFVTREQQAKINTSYLVTCQQLSDIIVRLPEPNNLVSHDETAQLVHPNSLHHFIWTCLNQKQLAIYRCSAFSGLAYSVKNLSNCGAETLNVLDVESFIMCATLSAKIQLKQQRHGIRYNSEKPKVLPVAVTEQLGTVEQSKWIEAAYRVYRNEGGVNVGATRSVLNQGIEVVRCVGYHGLDVKMLIVLANAFVERAKNVSKQTEMEFNEARAEIYWGAAIPLLEKLRKGQALNRPSHSGLFEYKSKNMMLSDVMKHIDEGKLFTGILLMKKKQNEKAISMFENLTGPYASYHQGQIYKSMAEDLSKDGKDVTLEMRGQHTILLTRARDCFYLTLDRLRSPTADPKHPLNSHLAGDIEKVERLLARADQEVYTHRNECDGMSDENGSVASSADYPFSSTHYGGITSTPHRLEALALTGSRREARPSPERLDAQMRRMEAAKDAKMERVLEQNRNMMEQFRCLMEDVKSLKRSVEDMNTQQDMCDLMREMKKELCELKKEVAATKTKTNAHLSDEDFFGLDEDYSSADYSLNAAAATPAAAASGFYQNYQGRASAAPIPGYPPVYYPGMAPMYPYGLALPQAAAFQYGQEAQLPNFPALNPIAPAVPAPLQQSPYIQPNFNQPTAFSQPPSNSTLQLGSVTAPAFPPTTTQPILNLPSLESNLNLTSTPLKLPTITSVPTSKAPPVNVVITASDPLPKTTVQTTQILSVTIPPQHLKGAVAPKAQPHSYQISLPSATTAASMPTFTTQSPVPSVAVTSSKPSLFSGFTPTSKANESVTSNTSNVSASSAEDHDPDFKPIVPLPDEVAVNTGEEDETVLFSERGKLYRFVDDSKEWRDRGIGTIKILKSNTSGKVRILMRREQIHKICANHFITADMALSAMPDNGRAFMWVANDFADETVKLEKLCIRFKTSEEAGKFKDAFESAVKTLPAETPADKKQTDLYVTPPKVTPEAQTPSKTTPEPKASLGGFTFSTPPTFKPKSEPPVTTVLFQASPPKPSPFASFNYTPKSTSLDFKPIVATVTPATTTTPASPDGNTEDFESTAEFTPVVPLPELVEVKTGEENAEVLFEERAKLLRFDAGSKEWKERGIGVIKILKENTIRLLMRREHILKVCCNHQVLKDMKFTYMKDNKRALSWYAKDYSEGVLQSEMFCIRFKTVEQTAAFLEQIEKSQSMLDNSNAISIGDKALTSVPEKKAETKSPKKTGGEKKVKSEPAAKPEPAKGWSEKLKPKAGTWECKNCYVANEPKQSTCAACETPKAGTSPQKTAATPPNTQFVFGVNNLTMGETAVSKPDFSFGAITPPASVSTGFVFGQNIATPGSAKTNTKPSSLWGEQFKPKEGSWECQTCLIRNDSDKLYCASCETPKDDTVPKKDPSSSKPKGVDLSTPGVSFSFGIPPSPSVKPSSFSFTFSSVDQPKPSANLDSPKTPADIAPAKFNFTLEPDKDTKGEGDDKFVFGSSNKNTFEFTPKSPRQHNVSVGEESDSYVEEEEDQIYFKPVVPLPDKVDVVTGEEDEEVLFGHRAKLFRLVQSEWKERGLGDVKILKNTVTGKIRVVMRREQVLKICLNHILTADIEYRMKDDKNWLFIAPDFSEGEIKRWQFCLRFKTPEVALSFRKAVCDALQGSTGDVSASKEPESEADSDVEFVSETIVSPEEQQEAIRLKLPPKFMAYRQLPDCTCATCQNEDKILGSNQDAKPASTSITTSSISSFTFTLKNNEATTPVKTTVSSSTSVFGTGSLLGSPSLASSGPSIFGGGSTTTTPTSTFFGSTPLFGNIVKPDPSKPVFGQSATAFPAPTFTNTKPEEVTSAEYGEEPVLKCDSHVTFASLAAKSDANAFGGRKDGEKSFAFLNSGAPVFGVQKPKPSTAEKTEEEEEEGGEGGEHDPHFEPIVPLPSIVATSTGEEEETAVFNDRAKLFRFDGTEWKERGVGQMKILHHPVNGTYRFLLRRDQVHKVVLNMLISVDVDLQPLYTSDKAWLWAGYNYADDQPVLEKLAIRFKSSELANQFKVAVDQIISKLETQAQLTAYAEHEDVSDEEDDDDEDDLDDEQSVWFMKSCSLSWLPSGANKWVDAGFGDIQLHYDQEVCASRILFSDSTGLVVSNSFATPNTNLNVTDNVCTWEAQDWVNDEEAEVRVLRATFENENDAADFHIFYLETMQFAERDKERYGDQN